LSGIYPMDTLAGLRTNVLADGLFSLGMLVVTGVGAGLLWRACWSWALATTSTGRDLPGRVEVADARVGRLRGASTSIPVPHWVVLLVAVPALWLAIGGAVIAVGRLLARVGW